MELANEMELERDHALDRPEQHVDDDDFVPEEALMDEANREEKASDDADQAEVRGAATPRRHFDRVLFDGGEFGTGGAVGSEEEQDFLGIPGLLEPDQVGELLRQRQLDQVTRRRNRPAAHAEETAAGVVDHRQLLELRNQLSKNVSAWSARTGTPHGMIHNKLREVCGGPAVAQANADQLNRRLSKLQDWFVGRK